MEIVTAAHSDTGKVRTRNEDSFICMSGQTNLVNVDAVLVVADGMGGHAAGDVASQMAVDHITEQIANAGTVIDTTNDDSLSQSLEQIIKEGKQGIKIFLANRIIFMIMTLGTLYRQAHKGGSHRSDAINHIARITLFWWCGTGINYQV